MCKKSLKKLIQQPDKDKKAKKLTKKMIWTKVNFHLSLWKKLLQSPLSQVDIALWCQTAARTPCLEDDTSLHCSIRTPASGLKTINDTKNFLQDHSFEYQFSAQHASTNLDLSERLQMSIFFSRCIICPPCAQLNIVKKTVSSSALQGVHLSGIQI